MKAQKIIILSFIIFTVSLFTLAFTLFPNGYVGTTKKNGALGCVCHGVDPNDSVSVFFSGPDSVAAGQTVIFQIKVSHGPAVRGGFNVAVFADTSSINVISGDNTVRKQEGELTHALARAFVNDTVSWSFQYTAPSTPQIDTLYATGNSTNHDGTSDGDRWNFSQNRPIRVYNPIGIINISSVAKDFSISQNYPNPFNPATQISFTVGKASDVSIIVYDMLGKEVAVLVNQNLKPGVYKTDYNASGMPSGAYLYSMFSNGQRLFTKKMLLIK
jgi:hypothetical protein